MTSDKNKICCLNCYLIKVIEHFQMTSNVKYSIIYHVAKMIHYTLSSAAVFSAWSRSFGWIFVRVLLHKADIRGRVV